jgi:hypothetical protein
MEAQMLYWHFAAALYVCAMMGASGYVPVGAAARAQIEQECDQWRATIKPGQPLTDELRKGVRVIPPHGAATMEYVAGRRNIWMGDDNRIERATCG